MSSPYFNNDTIAAIVTAPNAIAGVGIIRVSGADAWRVVSRVSRKHDASTAFKSDEIESHKLIRCVMIDAAGTPIDDGMLVWMKAPRSFTGEDVIELHLHGSPFLLRKVMHELQTGGSREALPGEFSFRAFRNGKLSLDQAESVADLISSRTEEGARRALDHLLGKPRGEIELLKRELIDRLAEVEIDIDFSDQGLSVFHHQVWAARLRTWVDKVERVREEFIRSQPLRDGIRIAFLGEPNSGKSSLFNRILGEERSIVSEEAGTTRDVVRESVQLNGLLFRLSDTAGIRATENRIEAQGIERTIGEASNAHLALWIFEGGTPAGDLSKAFQELSGKIGPQTKLIAVWNKADLEEAPLKWSQFFRDHAIPEVSVSALTGKGIPTLLNKITQLFQVVPDQAPDFSISRTRHFEVLGAAAQFVWQAISKVNSGEHFPDLLAADLRAALHEIGELTGEFTSDDLLNHIFAEFCIGK